jgi:hypothetical protein
MNRIGLVLSVIIILASNAVALIGVSVNRSDEFIRTIELTERELPLGQKDKEDSSVSLRLAWRRSPYAYSRSLSGEFELNQAKLEELGFDCSASSNTAADYRVPVAREAFVVLEYQGKAWEEWKQKAEATLKEANRQGETANRNTLQRQRENAEGAEPAGTRLFVVDASNRFELLQQKYPDQQKYLIMRGVVVAALDGGQDPRTGVTRPFRWGGYVSQLLPPMIQVPLPYSREISTLTPRAGEPPRYQVTLRFGSKHEPWVAAIKLMAGNNTAR